MTHVSVTPALGTNNPQEGSRRIVKSPPASEEGIDGPGIWTDTLSHHLIQQAMCPIQLACQAIASEEDRENACTAWTLRSDGSALGLPRTLEFEKL